MTVKIIGQPTNLRLVHHRGHSDLVRNLPEREALIPHLLLPMLEQRLVSAEGGDLGQSDDLPEVETFNFEHEGQISSSPQSLTLI